jgi:hypothetical protein
MAEWPKTFTTPIFAFIQDRDDTGSFRREDIGTCNYKVGKAPTRSKPDRVSAKPRAGNVKEGVRTKKEY